MIPALPAALIMANPPRAYPREWKDGAGAFGRNFGDALATEVAAQTGKYLTAALLREDQRYFRDCSANGFHRAWHAIAFTFVDRSVTGERRIAVANFAGAMAAGFTGNAYLPEGFDNSTHALQRSSGALVGYVPTLLVGYMTDNLVQEFQPELKRLAKKLRIPFVR